MTRRVVVKVCGITEERDAHEAVHLGVDALGFDFRKDSPRAIEPELARAITQRIPAFVTTVGVFADDPLIRVLETSRQAGISMIQFHGGETPGTCAAAAPFKWIKSFRVAADFDPDVLAALRRGEIGFVTLSSSNVARALVRAFDDTVRGRVERGEVKLVAISPETGKAVRELGLPVAAEADVYTVDGMVDAVVKLATRPTSNPGGR